MSDADATAIPGAGAEAGGGRRFSVREYRAGDETAILALFNRVFAIGNPDFVPRRLDHWRWAFPGNPEGHATMVAEADGALVGTFTAQPSRFRFPDGEFRLGQAVDTVIAPEFRASLRKNGVYLTLSHAFYERFGRRDDLRFLYGFPNPQALRIGTKFGGYEPVRCPVLESEIPLAHAGRWPDGGVEVEEVERFGLEVDAFDDALAPTMGVAARRTARYWNWRYADCPTTRYRLLRAQGASGELRGFLVHGFGWHGFRKEIVPIVDFLVAPGDRATWKALLADVARAAQRERGTPLKTLLAWTPPHHPHFADLAALGFKSQPSIFNLCIRRFADSGYTPEQATRELYINMGDSDIY
ncbi:MAG: GNAT family N-acetyltransferase [Planctomycetes bacterium]|nr:GNAT family N-acetyltransferase [Planctomycetota bacterium]